MTQRALKSVYLLLVAATAAGLACFITLAIWRSYARLQVMDAVTREGHLPPLPAAESLFGVLFRDSIPKSVEVVCALFGFTLVVTIVLSLRLKASGEPFKIFDPLVMLFFGAGFYVMGMIAGLNRYQAFRADSIRHYATVAFSYSVSQEIRDYISNNQQTTLIFAGFGAVLGIVSTLRAIQQFRRWSSESEHEGRRGKPSRFDHSQ